MKYSELLGIIYGNNLRTIINVLNHSVYVTDFKLAKDSIVINTGFIFKTHNSKKMELYYELETGTIIRQPKLKELSIPQLNGLISIKDKREYFNQYLEMILTEVPENDNNGTFYFLKDPRKYLDIECIKEITVIKDNKREYKINFLLVKRERSIKFKYPYFKNLQDPIFYNSHNFSYYESQSNNESNDKNDDRFDDDDIWDGNNPWPGLDPCDWRGG